MTIGADEPVPPTPGEPDAHGNRWLGWAKFAARWLIAIVGVAWVVSGLTIRDRVYVLEEIEGEPVLLDVALVEPFDPATDDVVVYEDPLTGEPQTAPASALLNGPDQDTITVSTPQGRIEAELAGMRLVEPRNAPRDAMPDVEALWIYTPERFDGNRVRRIELNNVAGGYRVKVPQPIVRTGLGGMVRDARLSLLVMSLLVFPITLISTGLRWWRLMGPLGIEMRLRRAFALNMVGMFYNTFMLGSTGGDFVKAYYAGKHAQRGRKAAAWLSVFVDRVIGLLVLVAMGGSAALIQYLITNDRSSAVAVACLQVAWASVAILLAASAATFVALHPPTRRVIREKTGINRVIEKTEPRHEGFRTKLRHKVRESLNSAYDVVGAYRDRPRAILEASLLTVPVHGTVIVSAMLAGAALDLPIPWPYYFVCVPVIVLAASMPISPQGAGVMEFFAVLLTRPQGATVAQAFALALSIRVVQILWNLTGGLFVLRGGYGQPAVSAEEGIDEPEHVAVSQPKPA